MLGNVARSLVGIIALTAATSAHADLLRTFDLVYSGARYGNSAIATASITLDLDKETFPGVYTQEIVPFVTDFSITVSGAASGNGTFGFEDFNGSTFLSGGFLLFTNGTLDFTRELIGQPTDGLPFGTQPDILGGSNGGDFNFFSNGRDPSAPNGFFNFEIATNGIFGLGDHLYLTSFAPRAVPEPSSLALCGMAGVAGLGYLRARGNGVRRTSGSPSRARRRAASTARPNGP